ncbi:MAG: hypothetical protein AB8G17_00085 [Gammaproteobacteria bacterium]
MLKVKQLTAVAATMVLCSTAAHGVELATNGGFETGDFTGWEQFPNAGTQTISTFNPSTGTYAVNLDATSDNPTNTLIKQANVGIGIVSAGQEVTISFDARGTTANGGVIFAEFFSEIDGGGVSATEILGGAPLALNADPEVWSSFSYTVFAGPDVSGGITLQLAAICGAVTGCTSDVFFDNVSITTVPVPGAVWLFGSALGLLGFAKRRKA